VTACACLDGPELRMQGTAAGVRSRLVVHASCTTNVVHANVDPLERRCSTRLRDVSSRTLTALCVCVCVCVFVSARLSFYVLESEYNCMIHVNFGRCQ